MPLMSGNFPSICYEKRIVPVRVILHCVRWSNRAYSWFLPGTEKAGDGIKYNPNNLTSNAIIPIFQYFTTSYTILPYFSHTFFALSNENKDSHDCTFTFMIVHYSKKLKEHDQHHLWYVDTLRSSC